MRSKPMLEQLSYEEKMLKTECPEEYYVSHILPHKLCLSLEYSQTRTFFSDLKIIFQTPGSRDYRRAMQFFLVQCQPTSQQPNF